MSFQMNLGKGKAIGSLSRRSNQMNEQEMMIAKKKAEIEAKLKEQQELEKQPTIPPSSSASSISHRPKKGFLSKNRWQGNFSLRSANFSWFCVFQGVQG